jgi:trimethylamine:corrinoid methyltransferase-like protein
MQAAMEKTFSGLLIALGHPYMVTGGGILDNALVTSPEQLIIDNEAIHFIRRICKPIQIDEETIGMDSFREGIRTSGHLLGEDHTVRYLRAGDILNCGLRQWFPSSDEESFLDLYERAHGKLEETIGSHRVEPFDPITEHEIRKISGKI